MILQDLISLLILIHIKLMKPPTFRGKLYWHNNRAIYFQKEIKLYWKTIIWEPHTTDYQYTKEEQIEEVIKVINSILYQARKLLVNLYLYIPLCIISQRYIPRNEKTCFATIQQIL